MNLLKYVFTCRLLLLLLLLLPCLLISLGLPAQTTPDFWEPAPAGQFAFIIQQADSISRPAALRPLLTKLQKMKKTGKGVVRIVHIGDSHTQADIMTGVVRRGMQEYFGNAGRGLVFPYQVARSNAPLDIVSSSRTAWAANRLAHPEIPVACGLSGFGIHSSARGATLQIGLKADSGWDNSFDRVRFFLADAPGCYTATLPDGTLMSQRTKAGRDTPSLVFKLATPVHTISLGRCGGDSLFTDRMSLYGASLEKQKASGVLYHTIGVNGAKYEQYNNTPLFWQQLPALQADCFIISMGTNEAQGAHLNREAFTAHCRTMVNNLRKASPGAVIIITTPAGSHNRGGKPNVVLQQVRDALDQFCAKENLPLWDLYRMTGGFRTAPKWKRSGLMAGDGIHYNGRGYALQGDLLLQALAAAYERVAGR